MCCRMQHYSCFFSNVFNFPNFQIEKGTDREIYNMNSDAKTGCTCCRMQKFDLLMKLQNEILATERNLQNELQCNNITHAYALKKNSGISLMHQLSIFSYLQIFLKTHDTDTCPKLPNFLHCILSSAPMRWTEASPHFF